MNGNSQTGLVCVCNSTYCDTLEFELPKNDGEVLMVSSSSSGLRNELNTGKFMSSHLFIEDGPYKYKSSNEGVPFIV